MGMWTVVQVVSLMLIIAHVNSQGADEELAAVVTAEMLGPLQASIDDLYNLVGILQEEINKLAASIQALSTETAVVGSVELAELQALIEVSNKQEDDIIKLIQSNSIWRQNFRVINSTFERLRKVVVFPVPTINNPPVASTAVRRILSSVQKRPNVTFLKLSATPKPVILSRPKLKAQ